MEWNGTERIATGDWDSRWRRKRRDIEALAGRGLHEHVLSFMPPRDTAQCPLTNHTLPFRLFLLITLLLSLALSLSLHPMFPLIHTLKTTEQHRG